MISYKISYVVKGSDHPGGIVTLDYEPQVGDFVDFGDVKLSIIEIVELMPPRGDFHYIHATCELAKEK